MLDMAHPVICIYCKEQFDRDRISFVQVSNRRYAHKECHQQKAATVCQEEKDYESLLQYIKQLFKLPYVSANVKKEIMDFRKQYGYTYSGIQKTLYWFYELKGNSIEKANGHLGIVPYVYGEASDYFYKLFRAAAASNTQIVTLPKKQYTIHSPEVVTAMKQKRFFDFEGEDGND